MALDTQAALVKTGSGFLKKIPWRTLLKRDNLILFFSAIVSGVGLWTILKQLSGEPQPSALPVSIGVGLFSMGIALKTILESRRYDELPKWLWPIRYASLICPAMIGIYFLSINLMRTQFNLLELWIVKYPEIPPIISILTLLLASFSLYIYLTCKRSEELIVFLINIPALIILNLNLLVLMTYWQNMPAIYNSQLPDSFILAAICISVTLLIGTIPFRGLAYPFVSEYKKSRWMAFIALTGGLLILFKGSHDAYQLYKLSTPENADLTAQFIVTSNLFVLILALLTETILLRQTHYYDEVSLYDRQLQENWVKRQELIYNIIQAIPSITLDLGEIFQKITTELGKILKVDRCVIARYDPQKKDLIPPIKEYRVSEDIPSLIELIDSKWRKAKDFNWLLEHVCDQKQPISFDLKFPVLSEETRGLLRELRVQAGLSCPIILQNQCFAILFIQQVKEKRSWNDDDREMIKSIADQTAIAIYQAQLFAQLSESESRFREVSESNMIGICFWRLEEDTYDAVITDANDAFLDLIGYSREEVAAGKVRWRTLTPSEFYNRDVQAIEALREKRAFAPFEKQCIRKNGQRIDILIGGALIGESEHSGVAFTLDITEQKKTEKALLDSKNEIRKLADDLEKRVAERTAQLEAVNKELEAFSYSVSHDLRTPLRTIDGFSQTVLDVYADRLDEKGKDYLRRIYAGSQEMAQLIDDMLQLSQLTRESLQIEPNVNLSRLADEVIDDLRTREPDRAVEVNIEENLTSDCDRRLMKIALQNLLGNAWKFTSKQKNALISFGKEVKNGRTVFYIRDNGAGFDMAYVHKLFGAFQRLHKSEEFPGTGIGLATVARIIHRHSGEIWAEGAVGKGATFYFTLNPSLEEMSVYRLEVTSPEEDAGDA